MSARSSNSKVIFSRCGVLDAHEKSAVVYDTNSKFRVANVDIQKDLDYVGVLSGVRDCVVTTHEEKNLVEIDGPIKIRGHDKTNNRNENINNKFNNNNNNNNSLCDISQSLYDSIIKPSDSIEKALKTTAYSFRYKYTSSLINEPSKLYGENTEYKMKAIDRLCKVPASTVGLKLKMIIPSGEEFDAIVHNSSGVKGFNNFNSSPLYFEAHSDMDVLMMMLAFFKYNGVWGGVTANMDLYKFDYAGAFFDHRWLQDADETSFMVARAQLLSAFFKCETSIKASTATNKRKMRDGAAEDGPETFFECNTDTFCLEAMEGSNAVVGGGNNCPHSSLHHLRLADSGPPSCVACFSTLFFVPKDVCNNFVILKDLAGSQKWVKERLDNARKKISAKKERQLKDFMLSLADLAQAAHEGRREGERVKDGEGERETGAGAIGNTGTRDAIKLGPCGRRWNWPSRGTSLVLHEFILYSLISVLRETRKPLLPEMDVDVLYLLLNPLGKMLLVFMHNSLVMSSAINENTPDPGGVASGKWWDVNYAGPNLWSFQITKCKIEKNKTLSDLSCMETLQRLPSPEKDCRVDDRIIFKGFCRGENLAGQGELVSDITQSVNTVALVLENRKFFVDRENARIGSIPEIGEALCSLEVTGYRPNRAQDSVNSGRVSARVMRILDSREGARLWHSPRHDALLFERVNHDVDVSTEAMERALSNHKILYYDIETNTVDFTDKSAVITSICCCLCTGGDLSRGGERSVFGLAAPGTDADELAQRVRKMYPGFRTEEYVVTDHAPDLIRMYSNEFEMLLGFTGYVRKTRPHVISGWNSSAFDDPFVFTRIVKHLSVPLRDFVVATDDTVNSVLPKDLDGKKVRMTSREERLALAENGLFALERFMDYRTGFMREAVSADLLAGASSQANSKFHQNSNDRFSSGNTGSAGWFQKIVGGCCTAIRLDLMEVCAKAYRESLSEFNLNAVLAKVSNVADRLKNVKDEVDLHYHLLGFLKLESVQDQATVHVYCCKDAYLTAVVATSVNKEGEIFRLCLDSALIESVVTSNLVTPLCIGEGAVCRNMGAERAGRRGVGVRRHSIATDTKGGMVSQPIVNHVPYQTVDMTSLYPMIMGQNNLCTSTFATHRQVMDLRDRMVLERVASSLNGRAERGERLLKIVDECNFKVLDAYRPIDIAVSSWKNTNSDDCPSVTRLERMLGLLFCGDSPQASKKTRKWCVDSPPNMAMTAAGLDYFPEVVCDVDIQQAAKVNDDTHVAPASLEYLLQVLPVLIIVHPHLASQITAGKCDTAEECLSALEKEFDEERDRQIIRTHWTFSGTPQKDFCSGPVTRAIEIVAGLTGRDVEATLLGCQRMGGLLDRIYRRVNAFDSADDYGVRLWSSRLINVGMLVRTWNVKSKVLRGVIPAMQMKYRADRVVMQNNAKKFAAAGDAKKADLNKIGQLIMKLSMNSMYGCLALRTRSSKREFSSRMAGSASSLANSAVLGGVGGGTRHSATANQITENARCVFGNIGCALQHVLPGVKQAYGDTDSVFCVHNIPGDGGVPSASADGSGRMVYAMDLLLKLKLSTIIPILVNCTTKGIRFVERRDAGTGMMSIAHERLAVLGLLFAKKTYHMLHLDENSAAFRAMVATCKKTATVIEEAQIDRFVSGVPRPRTADGFVVPHNPALIFRAANSRGGEKLKDFLRSEGIDDENSMSRWFASSDVWVELDCDAVNDLYASKIVDSERGSWIDAETAKPLEETRRVEAVSQASAAFKLYKKGAFVKKGISASTKIKGLQSLIARSAPASLANPKERYLNSVRHHVDNFASQTTDPSMIITSARVNKLDSERVQDRPNPLALAINNHLNPSNPISLGEKFKTVTSVSAWSLQVTDPSEIPAGYFHGEGVRWNPESMKGSVPFFSVKNLSVVPNSVSTAYDTIDTDKKALWSMVKKNADVLCTASAVNGFSLREGALSFSTGVVVANDLAMKCIGGLSEGKCDRLLLLSEDRKSRRQREECQDEECQEDLEDRVTDFHGEEGVVDGRVHEREAEKKNSTANANFLSETKNDIRGGILSRLINSVCSACGSLAERRRVIEDAETKSLKEFITQNMKLDERVADQMEALICQVEISKEICTKKRQPGGRNFKSMLDDMVAGVEVRFAPVLEEAAKLTRTHWIKCPVCEPEIGAHGDENEDEDEEEKEKDKERGSSPVGVPFGKALEAMAGKYKCTNTCDLACCQALYFVLLCTLALKFENERRSLGIPFEQSTKLMADSLLDGDQEIALIVMEKIRKARKKHTVKTLLPNVYNSDSDCLVYLFEPSRPVTARTPSMTVDALKDAIWSLSESKMSGKIWNCTDSRFFGNLADRESVEREEALYGIERQLPFVTGFYHTSSVEIAAACLSVKI